MLEIVLSNQFKKDLKLASKQDYKPKLPEKTVDKIADNIKLEDKYRDHALTENYIGFRGSTSIRINTLNIKIL